MDFSHWKSDHQEQTLSFDCKYCQESKRDQKRVCFLNKATCRVRFPAIPDSFSGLEERKLFLQQKQFVEWEEADASAEEVIEHFIKVHALYPNLLPTEILLLPLMRLGVKGEAVCPVGLLTYKANWFTELESAAEKYKTLPFNGNWLDQPQYIIDAFNTIRGAESKYMSKKLKSKKGKKT